MKQRRVFMTLGLILGILALSLAYAAITSQTLDVTVNATAATSDANFDVKFTGDVTSSGDGTVTGYIDTAKDSTGRTAVINVSGLTTKGQKATACINIINNSEEVKAILSIASITHTNTTWYKIEAEIGETTYWDSSTQKPILLPGEVVPAYITVELLQTPATDADVSAAVDTMEIKINAEPVSVDAELGDYGTGGSGNTGGDTEDNVKNGIATICDVSSTPCLPCNQTGICPGEMYLDDHPTDGEGSCFICEETTTKIYDAECDNGCANSIDYFVTLCDTCYETGLERINSSHSSACLMCYGLGTAPTWSFCEEHNTYGFHAYCEYCDYYYDRLDDVSQLQHECN